MRTLRATERRALPWKNGGGLTREVLAQPPGSDLGHFDWRVSIAEIHRAGPFSRFPGIERRMAVLEGCLRLSIDEGAALSVTPDTPPVEFSGDVPTFADPVGGPVTDLNVMMRRGRFDCRFERRVASAPIRLTPRPGTRVIVALSELIARCAAEEADLAKLDALLIEGDSRCDVIAQAAAASFYLIEICARP
jgi:environmental stress-induced protein Ves